MVATSKYTNSDVTNSQRLDASLLPVVGCYKQIYKFRRNQFSTFSALAKRFVELLQANIQIPT